MFYASGRLWNYYRDKFNDNANENNDDSCRIKNEKTITSESFEYKAKLNGSTKMRQMNIDIFLNKILLESIDCLF